MSEPSSGVPAEIADAQVEAPTDQPDGEPDTLELEVDEEKVAAWDEVKADYQVEPDGAPVPNSMDQATPTTADRDSDPVDSDPADSDSDSADAADSADSADADSDSDSDSDGADSDAAYSDATDSDDRAN